MITIASNPILTTIAITICNLPMNATQALYMIGLEPFQAVKSSVIIRKVTTSLSHHLKLQIGMVQRIYIFIL